MIMILHCKRMGYFDLAGSYWMSYHCPSTTTSSDVFSCRNMDLENLMVYEVKKYCSLFSSTCHLPIDWGFTLPVGVQG